MKKKRIKSSQSYIFESEFHHFFPLFESKVCELLVEFCAREPSEPLNTQWYFLRLFLSIIKVRKLNFQHVSTAKCLQCNSQGLLNSFQFHIISTYYYDFFIFFFPFDFTSSSHPLDIPSETRKKIS